MPPMVLRREGGYLPWSLEGREATYTPWYMPPPYTTLYMPSPTLSRYTSHHPTRVPSTATVECGTSGCPEGGPWAQECL